MIPEFDINGVVPPIRPDALGNSDDRSPYQADMLMFCLRFGETPERRKILRGLLLLRKDFRDGGMSEKGFQWINGSFVEDIERLEGRPPNDIDVVTFIVFGNLEEQQAKFQTAPHLFIPEKCKELYKVDHRILPSDYLLTEDYAQHIAYWYSMWSNQRKSNIRKGFISVSLTSNDAEALAWIESQDEGDTP